MKIKVQIGYKFIIGFLLVVSAAAFSPKIVHSLNIVDWLKEPVSFLIAILIGLILGSILSRSFTKDFWEFDPNGNAVNETELENLISVYPSPSADGKFTVSGLQFKVKIIDIYNVSGKLVYHSTVNRKQETVNLSEGSGIYFIHLSTEKGSVTKKVLVQK